MSSHIVQHKQVFKLASLFASLTMVVFLGACSEEKPHQPASPVIPYIHVSAETVTLTRELPGRVSAFTVAEIRPQVSGIIKERLFEEGSDVVAGQVLYQIDPVIYEAAYRNAKAELARSQADENASRLLMERSAKLVKTGAVGRQDYDDAVAAYERIKAQIEAAREALETTRINLGYTRVTAPISGRTGRSLVTKGALVTQNQPSPLAVIQQIDVAYVDVFQSSAEMLRIRHAKTRGQMRDNPASASKVRLLLEDGAPYVRAAADENGRPDWIEGELLFSDITIEQSTGVFNIRAKFDNAEGTLLPGMYVRAVIEEGVKENAVLAPQKSVGRDLRNRPQVFILTKNNPAEGDSARPPLGTHEYYVESRSITIDRDHNDRWLVSAGLEPGEMLVVDGLIHLRHGMTVAGKEVMPSAAPANSGDSTEAGRR